MDVEQDLEDVKKLEKKLELSGKKILHDFPPREFVIRELELSGLLNSDLNYDREIANSVLELFEVFKRQNHSMFSAVLVGKIFFTLVQGLPLTPLKGSDSEWKKVEGFEDLYQNTRCLRVFKKGDVAYDQRAKVFVQKVVRRSLAVNHRQK